MIEIWTEELPKGWEWTPNCYVGGTPEFVVNTAQCSDAVVYYDGPPGCFDGIFYLPRNHFKGDDVVLACNSKPPRLGKYNIIYTNWYHAREKDYLEFDERIVISPYHQKIFGSNSRIVSHSCWPHQFKDPIKTQKQCLYSSSPDRGGEFLKKIWPDVNKATGAVLITTYNKSISEEEMIYLYKSSQFWLHPGQGIELFCIAAVKAQVAKCVPVVVPNMALETTVKYGVKTTLENYKRDLIEAILNPPEIQDVDFGDWQIVTDELFKNIKKA